MVVVFASFYAQVHPRTLADSSRSWTAPAEMRQIFARVGLHGDFWDPQADTLA
jgi:hypothetical protein